MTLTDLDELETASPPPTPATKSRFDRSTLAGQAVSWLLVGLILAAWIFYAARQPDFILPSPAEVWPDLKAFFFDWSLAQHTYTSFVRVLVATVMAVVLGSGTVLLAEEVPLLRPFVRGRVIPLLNSFPSLGWAMLGIIWFGVTTESVIFVETAIVLPFSMINMAAGIDAIDPNVVEMGRSFTRSRRRVFLRITLPLLAPYLFASVRTSYGVAWKVSLIAELFGASVGLGFAMNFARQNFNTPRTVAAVLVVVILVYAVDRLLLAPVSRRFAAPQ